MFLIKLFKCGIVWLIAIYSMYISYNFFFKHIFQKNYIYNHILSAKIIKYNMFNSIN